MRSLVVSGFMVVALTTLLSGCGQKGPLYLPVTPPRSIPTMPPAAATAKPPSTATYPAKAQTHNPPAATKPEA
ncbi:MAG TPA: lipoprotein [Gammaproteobacteria bacterium]|nr:lipoprotein [Gammaproteobacteria bacterium]